ncbi:MAG: DUF5060 domain-containing protein [Limisphaerales bacterium]
MRASFVLFLVAFWAGLGHGATVTLTRLNEPVAWALLEFRVEGVPPGGNPFDPEQVAVDATLTSPSGATKSIPGFWYRAYSRRLENGAEALTAQGEPEWRLRLTPTETGAHQLTVTVRTNGQPAGPVSNAGFQVPPRTPGESATAPGFVRLAGNQRYFETDQGEPLPLVGHCVCWHHARGTYDYEDWLAPMAAAGENYTRLWMAPWAFGIEAEPGSRLNYRLDRAWQLDEVLRQAGRHGIRLMLCFDYHGMFETEPDFWGGNNNWPKHPYNQVNGGPCATQNDFFTHPDARRLYRHRLRYLVARYGASPHLLAWQFFNEIDNVYRWLTPASVAAWHAEMGAWLKANDPWNHLVTTSLTGSSDRADIWSLPQMDFAMYHSYAQANPTEKLPEVIRSFVDRYRKPMMIGEFGTDWRGWRREQDPFLRGWRQGIWAGALGGSVGTSMSWWWEDIHAARLHPVFRGLNDFLKPSDWGHGDWQPVTFETQGDPPATLGDAIPGGEAFSAHLAIEPGWGGKPRGSLAIANRASTAYAPGFLNAFVHGTAHPDLRTPFRLAARLAPDARLVLHLNSVSGGAVLRVLVDGVTVTNRALPNKDGQWEVNNEYDEDLIVDLPEGRHTLEVRNVGVDWFNLDWVRVDGVLPSAYTDDWQPSPVATGLGGPKYTLVYAVNPAASFPSGATNSVIQPWRGGTLQVKGLPAGRYRARWFDPQTAATAGETLGESDGTRLVLALPELVEDLAGRVERIEALTMVPGVLQPGGEFLSAVSGRPGEVYRVEASGDFELWSLLRWVTNLTGVAAFQDNADPAVAGRFYRATLED